MLVLDAPASGLDLCNQEIVLGWIRRLAATGRMIVFSTHQVQHATAVADDVLLMGEAGQICGRTREVLTEPHLSELFGVDLRQVSVGDGEIATAFVPI